MWSFITIDSLGEKEERIFLIYGHNLLHLMNRIKNQHWIDLHLIAIMIRALIFIIDYGKSVGKSVLLLIRLMMILAKRMPKIQSMSAGFFNKLFATVHLIYIVYEMRIEFPTYFPLTFYFLFLVQLIILLSWDKFIKMSGRICILTTEWI